MKKLKKYYLLRILLSTLFGLGFGVLLFFLRGYASEIFVILQIAMGLGAVLLNLPPLAVSLAKVRQRGEWLNLLLALASIALGAALILSQIFAADGVLPVLLVLYAVVFPLARILLVAGERKRQLQREWPQFLLGAFMMVVFLTEAERRVFLIGGIVCLALSVVYLVCGLVRMHFRFADEAADGQTEP